MVQVLEESDAQIQDFVAAADAVLLQVRDRLGFEIALVSRRQGDDYVVLDSIGGDGLITAGDVMPWTETFCYHMSEGRGPVVCPSIDDVPSYAELRDRQGAGLQALISVPIRDPDGQLYGTLCGYSRAKKTDRLLDEQPLAQLWADLLGMVLASELARGRAGERASRAEQAAETDLLTGLGNRRLWDRVIAEEEVRCRRYGALAAVIVIDLDDLKGINDRRGHAAGDAALSCAATTLTETVGGRGSVVRLGGDEFAVLLPDGTADGARDLLDQLLTALDVVDVPCSGGSAVRTLGTDLVATWRLADLEMYQAKRRAKRRPPLPAGAAPTAGSRLLLAGAPSSRAVRDEIDDLLALTRRHMGSDVVLIGEIRDARWVVRNVSARVDGWDPGLAQDAEVTYCQGLLDRQVAPIVTCTADLPVDLDLSWTPTPIGSCAGVPLPMPGTGSRATLCCFSEAADTTLNERDLSFLRLVADTVSQLIVKEEASSERHHRAIRDLDSAREPGAMTIAYQPIVELATGTTIGLEALCRLPELPHLTPSRLFAAAEEAGHTADLELLTARRALERLDDIDGFLALNLSAGTIVAPGFHHLLSTQPVHRLVIELSEHVPVDDYDTLESVLAPFRARGLRVAVDDAGAGFASMRHVVRLRPDIIKLDISLIRNLARDPLSQRLALALARFGQEAGALVVAEGVEDAEAVTLLRSLGVAHGQGFHLGWPAPLPSPAEPAWR